MTTSTNLKPFTGADDPRRQNGRKKGSKNVSTLVREMLNREIDFRLPIDESFKDIASNNASTTYMEAIVMSMIIKSLNGDVRATTWLSDQFTKSPDPESIFQKSEIIFQVVPITAKKEDVMEDEE